MNKKARVFAYSAIANSLIFGSAFISGCGDSGSTTPAFPTSSSTSNPSTEPTPNDPSTPTTPQLRVPPILQIQSSLRKKQVVKSVCNLTLSRLPNCKI